MQITYLMLAETIFRVKTTLAITNSTKNRVIEEHQLPYIKFILLFFPLKISGFAH